MSVMAFVATSGIVLGLLIIAALLLRPDANRQANALLAASMACTLGYLSFIVILNAGLLESAPWLTVLAYPYTVSSPLLYGYVMVMTSPTFRLEWRHLLHLWPLLTLLAIGWLAPGSGVSEDSLRQARGGWPPNATALSGLLLYSVAIIYSSLALRHVIRHGRRLRDEFSYEEKVTLRWLRILMTLCLVMASIGLVVALARLLPGVELWPRSISSTVTVIITYYLIAFFGLSQPDVFAGQRLAPRADQPAAPSPAGDAETFGRVEKLMSQEKLYLEHELRIAHLAERLELPTAQISQAINQCAGKNFFDFVSAYRVEQAKTLLGSSKDSMTNIAQAAGFNSQSAFYRQFRKITGLAPKEYQRQLGEAGT